DLLLRALQQRLDAGARRRMTERHPGIPHLVHLVDGADVGKPDGGGEELRLVGAGLGEKAVDQREDLAGLLGETVPHHLVRGEPGEIDGVAVHDHLAHARIAVDAFNAHSLLPLRPLARGRGSITSSSAALATGAVARASIALPSNRGRSIAGTACARTLRM